MDLITLYNHVWSDFASMNQCAAKLFNIFTRQGENTIAEDIAFRTINDPRINIEILARPFLNLGYQPFAEHISEDKCIRSVYFRSSDENAPSVLISELQMEEIAPNLHDKIESLIDRTADHFKNKDLIISGNPFQPLSYSLYNQLRSESSYAAWFYLFGFRANYISLRVNMNSDMLPVQRKYKLLIENGFQLRTPDWEIRANSHPSLRQSEALTDNFYVPFTEGVLEIPGCFYEFTQHYSIAGASSVSRTSVPSYSFIGIRNQS